MSASDVKQAITKPFGTISTYGFSTLLRAVCNAAIAIETFTNRQNYGPAIQELILALGGVAEDYTGNFDLLKLTEVLGKICDELDADDFDSIDDVEMNHGCIFLWDHTATAEERLKYYKDRYSYDRELNPVEEA